MPYLAIYYYVGSYEYLTLKDCMLVSETDGYAETL